MPLSAESTNPQSGLSVADLARIGVGIVGLLYALGFLVVTFHLSQFGVAPVTWLRPQYLLAGIWCLLPAVLFTVGLAFAGIQFAEPWIRGSMVVPRKTRIYRHILGAIQGLFSLVAAFVFISRAISFAVGPSLDGRSRWGPSSIITLKLAGLSFAAAMCAGYAIGTFYNLWTLGDVPTGRPTALIPAGSWREHPWGSMRWDRWVALISFSLLGAFGALYFIVLYILTFSVSVYSAISPTYGGGGPQRVVFLIEGGIQGIAPMVVDSSGTRSVPYNLLLTTESSYVVESPAKGELAIEFKRDSVRGMIALR
jgi:hypothetical protein